jgi:hypothetical protein
MSHTVIIARLTNGTGVHAVAQACDNATYNHLWDAKSCSLQRGTDAQNYTSEHNALPSTKLFSENQTEDGAEEASNLVDGDDSALQRRAATRAGGRIDLREGLREGVSSEQAAHNTLIYRQ